MDHTARKPNVRLDTMAEMKPTQLKVRSDADASATPACAALRAQRSRRAPCAWLAFGHAGAGACVWAKQQRELPIAGTQHSSGKHLALYTKVPPKARQASGRVCYMPSCIAPQTIEIHCCDFMLTIKYCSQQMWRATRRLHCFVSAFMGATPSVSSLAAIRESKGMPCWAPG